MPNHTVQLSEVDNKEVELIEVIHTSLLRRGKGVEGDPIRVIHQYWTKDGVLIAEKIDPFLKGNNDKSTD